MVPPVMQRGQTRRARQVVAGMKASAETVQSDAFDEPVNQINYHDDRFG